MTTVDVIEQSAVYNDKGMHPGVFNGRRCFPKRNTAKRPSRARRERALAGWDRHIETNPRDEMAKRCRANLQDRLNSL